MTPRTFAHDDATLTDEELIQWFADLGDDDPAPPNAAALMRTRVARLVGLGVMGPPANDDLFIDVVHQARDACLATITTLERTT